LVLVTVARPSVDDSSESLCLPQATIFVRRCACLSYYLLTCLLPDAIFCRRT
jgi:hypothetical protein